MATIQEFKDRCAALGEAFTILSAERFPATFDQVHKYEKEKGLSFSEEVQAFLLQFGQMVIEVNEAFWSRPDEFDTVPEWQYGYGFYVYGLSSYEKSPFWLSYDEKYKESETAGKEALGQKFFTKKGDLYHAYTNEAAVIVETGKYGEKVEMFEGDFFDFLISEIDKLEKDYERFKKNSDEPDIE